MGLRATLSSPLTKSTCVDSVACRWWRWVADGSGAAAGSSVGDAGGVVGDATLAGPRLLRPAAGRACRRGVRRLRRGTVRALLRRAPGPTVAAAGAPLPHAAGRLLRGHRQRARPGVALRRQPVAARVPPPRGARAGAGPLLALAHPRPTAAGGARRGVHLGAAAVGPARPR